MIAFCIVLICDVKMMKGKKLKMKIKRLLSLVLAVMVLLSVYTFSVSASNVDSNFEIHIPNSSVVANSTYAARVKDNSSSAYVNYKTRVGGSAASGPYQFEVQIWGSYSSNGPFTDCSSYTINGIARTKAVVTRGTVGLVRQDVYERYGAYSYAQIYGKRISESGIALGCWSPDSVGSYSYYNSIA